MTQMVFELPPASSYAADDFLVLDANREAHRAVMNWPDWPGPTMVLCGPEGSGKTHLAHCWAQLAGAKFLTGELAAKHSPFELLYRSRAWVLETPEVLEEAQLFHWLNAVAERRGNLLITLDAPPSHYVIELADLSSRLNALPLAELHKPDGDLLEAILIKAFTDRQLRVGGDVITYLLARIERSPRAARDIAARIDQAALSARRNITLPLVREVLEKE